MFNKWFNKRNIIGFRVTFKTGEVRDFNAGYQVLTDAPVTGLVFWLNGHEDGHDYQPEIDCKEDGIDKIEPMYEKAN